MPATKYTRYNDIPQLTRGGSWECDFNLDEAVRFVRNKDEQVGLDLDPDFQRGHVWNEAQQIAWLEFFIRGGKTGRVLYFNQPSWMMRATTAYDDFVIVDGKQRYKAIERFIGGEIKVYGSYVGEYTDSLRCTHTLKINVNNLQTRAAVLQWYIEMNSGGTPHIDDEIERVKGLLEQENVRPKIRRRK